MSNFLRQLLERSLIPTASTLRPRLASRFESGLGTGSARPDAADHSVDSLSSASLHPVESPKPAPPPSTATVANGPVASPAAVADPSLAVPVAATPILIRSAAPPAAPAAASTLMRVPPAPVSPLSATRELPLPPFEPNTLLVERLVERIHELAPSVRTRSESPPPPSRADPTVASAPTPTPSAVLKVRSDSRSLAATVRPSIPRIPSNEPAPSSPHVHLTIGKIEIRAVMPPAPTPVARRPAPSQIEQSLDVYLARRSGRTP